MPSPIPLAIEATHQMTNLIIRQIRVKRRTALWELHLKQAEEIEEGMTESLTGYFDDQVKQIQKDLNGASELSPDLVESSTDLKLWEEKLIEVSFPILAEAFAEAASSTLEEFLQRSWPFLQEKVTSALQWLQSTGQEVPPGITTEIPRWMISPMREALSETFEQDYWLKIPKTTADNIQSYLDRGIREGDSMRDLVGKITTNFPNTYSKTRAQRVAQTEATNALNAGRKAGIQKLDDETPEEVHPISVWLSVLGDTTRAAHADLDGVEEDEDGMFNLNGVLIPWPGHHSLPPEDRIWCYCTLITEFI